MENNPYIPCTEAVYIDGNADDTVTYETYKQITDSNAVFTKLCE